MRVAVAKALYQQFTDANEVMGEEYAAWEILGDKQSWLERADAALAAAAAYLFAENANESTEQFAQNANCPSLKGQNAMGIHPDDQNGPRLKPDHERTANMLAELERRADAGMMDFEKALKHIKEGGKVRRASWPSRRFIAWLRPETPTKDDPLGQRGNDFITVHAIDVGSPFKWDPLSEDISASDWEVVA